MAIRAVSHDGQGDKATFIVIISERGILTGATAAALTLSAKRTLDGLVLSFCFLVALREGGFQASLVKCKAGPRSVGWSLRIVCGMQVIGLLKNKSLYKGTP